MGNEPKVIYKPVISKNGYGYQVSYHNTKGEKVQYQVNISNTINKRVVLPKALSQIVSGEKPNIDKEELLLKFWELYGSIPGNYYSAEANNDAVMNRAEKLIDFFASPKSEGGEKITPNEQYKMMEIWHKWFGN